MMDIITRVIIKKNGDRCGGAGIINNETRK